ncbi:Transcriptional regulator, GntR family [Actinomycetales bacterium JB111]|nr:Transcriptional regulator, GntR family [Actinomycetales bacterium JB111]
MMLGMNSQSAPAPDLSGIARGTATASGRPARLPVWVADQLEEALLGGTFAVGTQMPTEPALAERFGVSRQVVREAARLLEDRGLVEIRAGRGMTVLAPTVESSVDRMRTLLRRGDASFDQLMELRQMTEVDMSALAARNRTDEDVASMQAAIADAAAHLDDYAICMDADLAFHMAVARATHNPFVLAIVQPVNVVLRDVYRKPIEYLATQTDTVAEHTSIADAIAAGDARAARKATALHLGRVVDDAGRLVDEDLVTEAKTDHQA